MSGLSSHHNDWVENRVKAGFEASNIVNSVLLGQKGVQDLPNDPERVIRQIQGQLTATQADFMMDPSRPEFTYQSKLVAPNDRIDLLRALVDGQPRQMGMPKQEQDDLWMPPVIAAHLSDRRSRVVDPAWFWELGQGNQIISTPQQGDDSSLLLPDRSREFLRSLPAGMRGTDRWTWGGRMAACLKEGKPLDVFFPGNAKDTEFYENFTFTVLDEEGELTEDKMNLLVCGSFDSTCRQAYVGGRRADLQYDWARFRASADGAIGV